MIILDTNVLSALMHLPPDGNVLTWLDRQPRASIWTTSITIFEIKFGLELMPAGKRRSALLHSLDALLEKIDGRIVPFDSPAAEQTASLMASRRTKGRPMDLRDTMIAGIVLAQHASLATRNTAHFADIAAAVVNPWAA